MTELYSLHTITAAADDALFAILATQISGLSRHQARMAVKGGLVRVGQAVIIEPKHDVQSGAKISCDLRHGIQAAYHARIHGAAAPQEQPFTIIHQDEQVVVVDKNVGVVSAPTQSPGAGKPERGHVPEHLRRVFRKRGQNVRYIGVIHRLDKETSGCLCFALTRDAQRLLAPQFATHAAGRTYRCIVMRTPKKSHDTLRGGLGRAPDGRRRLVQDEEGGKEMVTHFRVLHSFRDSSGRDLGAELEVQLETGRTHQIRVSLAGIGCPVYGDHVYGRPTSRSKNDPPAPRSPRMMLHAHKLSFDHPATGERVEVVAPIPRAFTDFIAQLRG